MTTTRAIGPVGTAARALAERRGCEILALPNLLLNCTERLYDDPVAFAAALLELDPERLLRWLFARCVQECLGEPELYEIAVRIAP